MSERVRVAIETSGPQGSIAASRGGRLLAETSFGEAAAHSREVLPALRALGHAHGFGPADLELIAVDVGPGALTGIRVGLAAAKTLAWATRAAIAPVVSLDAIASRIASPPPRVACAVDGRRGEIFAAVYQRTADGRLARAGDVRALAAPALAAELPRGSLVAGAAAATFADVFRAAGLEIAEPDLAVPRASDVLRLGEAAFAAGRIDDPMKLQPLYLRPGA
jgi:tRNA threonylcarbamoyladenosine biosynthesis protein TsaB